MRRLLLFLCGTILVTTVLLSRFTPATLLIPSLSSSHSRLTGAPRIMLWAWERPEELRFIDPREVGIAFLAATIALRGEQVAVRPRLQPLQAPQGTFLMPVVRIEADRFQPPVLSSDQQAQVALAIVKATRLPQVIAMQVDFDARVSERPFYRSLLHDLRRRLPATMGLSITALASWCLSDDWLSGLPIDEAVPMLYRMGFDRRQVLLHLEAGRDFRSALCRQSVGVSTDELRPKLPAGRRMYIFHPRPWSEGDAQRIIQEVKR